MKYKDDGGCRCRHGVGLWLPTRGGDAARLTIGWGCHGWGARKKNSRSAAEMVADEEVAAGCVASVVDASWWLKRCVRKMVESVAGAEAAAWSCGGRREWRLPWSCGHGG